MKNDKLERISKYILIFFFISFLGWVWETIYLSLKYMEFMDRGFLRIPICPIYGFSLMLVYFLLGTPKEGRGLLKNVHNKYLLGILYFLMAIIIPTLLELATGYIFDEYFHTRLWTYEENFMNYKGYICPSVSLCWGVLITLAMRYIFPHIINLFNKIPASFCKIMAIVMSIITIGDFIYLIYKNINELKMRKILKI